MTKFGIGQIGNVTPAWAKYGFRIYFFVSKAVVGWMAATSIIDKETLGEVTLFITLLSDPIVYGVSKMFGVQPEESEK